MLKTGCLELNEPRQPVDLIFSTSIILMAAIVITVGAMLWVSFICLVFPYFFQLLILATFMSVSATCEQSRVFGRTNRHSATKK